MEQQVAVDGQEEQSNWTTFLKLIKICGQCCYVFCPPVPELVTRKLAFHPPPKAFTYRIVLKDGTEAKSAKDLLGKEFGLVLTDGIRTVSPQENRRVMSSIDTFVTTTIYGNQLVGARIRPTVMSVSYSSFDRADVEQVSHIYFSYLELSCFDLLYNFAEHPKTLETRLEPHVGCWSSGLIKPRDNVHRSVLLKLAVFDVIWSSWDEQDNVITFLGLNYLNDLEVYCCALPLFQSASPMFCSIHRFHSIFQVIIFSQPNSSDLGYMLHPCPNIMQRMSDFLGCDIYWSVR